jgi:transposase-like protein
MAKSEEKLQALALRRDGASIKEIAKSLDVSAGSVSKWVQDIELTDEQQEFLRSRQIASGHRGRMMGAEVNRRKKLEQIRLAEEEAANEIRQLSKDTLFFIGLGLYWGEGTKSDNGSLSVSNSNQRVIGLMMRWFMECFGVSKDRFMPRIFISNTHKEREETLLKYWSDILGIPITQFRKTVFLDKGKKLYENHDTYYGVMALRVAKGSNIRYKILAQIERVAQLGNMPA